MKNKWFERYATKRKADFVVGPPEDPYMLRWWIIPRNKWFNIYLHRFLHSDDDRALHDHPSWNISIILKGEYKEWGIAAGGVHHAVIRKAGQWKFRFARTAHRIELHNGPCWTLFINGAKLRNWGFHCPKGWRPWQQFVDERDHGSIGRGCD
jgi:hypothetical protein